MDTVGGTAQNEHRNIAVSSLRTIDSRAAKYYKVYASTDG